MIRDGALPPPDVACGEGWGLFESGDFEGAADWLRGRASEDPGFGTLVSTDLCLGRALVGAGWYDDALSLLVPLTAAPNVDIRVRTSACVYSAWAHMAQDDPDEAARTAESCPQPLALRDSDTAGYFPDDGQAIRALLMVARAHRGDLPGALELAGAALESDGLDTGTRHWVLAHALDWAPRLSLAEVEQLEAAGTPFGRTVAAYVRLWGAIDGQRWTEVDALLPGVQERLSALSATQALDDLREGLEQRDPDRPPVFGCVLTLTGPDRRTGRAALAGLLLGQSAFSPGVESHSNLLIRDAGETAQSAAAAVEALDAAGVLALVGPVDPHTADAVGEAAANRGIPAIVLSTDPAVTRQNPWVFRLFADPEVEGLQLAELAASEGLYRVAVAQPSPTPRYMERLVDAFTREARGRGIDVAAPVTYRVDDLQREVDAAAELLASRDFDALLIADTGTHANTLAAYLGVRDVWARPPGDVPTGGRRYALYLGNSFWHNPEFLLSGPDYLAGGVFSAWIPLESGEEVAARFVDDFERVYGRRPGFLDAFAFDALGVIRHVTLELGNRNRETVRRALSELEGVEGATGVIGFGPDRSGLGRPTLMQVTSSGFQPL